MDWADLGIDLLIEASGCYGRREEFTEFLNAGCPRLLLSHPAHSSSDVDATIIAGINQQTLTGSERLVLRAGTAASV